MKVFVVLNPVAGQAEPARLQPLLTNWLSRNGRVCQIYCTSGNEDVAAVVRKAVVEGCSLVVAAGGDGTVSAVADGLAGGAVPLGIVPVGTGNLVARELDLPLEPEAACRLLVSAPPVRRLDGMQVGSRIYISHVSMGIYARIAEEVAAADKRQEGRLAYVRAILREMSHFPRWPFVVEVDGQAQRYRLTMILLANVAAVGIPPLRWGEHIRPDDGRIDVCLVQARSWRQYLELIWLAWHGRQALAPEIAYLSARHQIRLHTRQPMPVRGDGEIIGQSGVSIQVKPGILPVVAPPD